MPTQTTIYLSSIKTIELRKTGAGTLSDAVTLDLTDVLGNVTTIHAGAVVGISLRGEGPSITTKPTIVSVTDLLVTLISSAQEAEEEGAHRGS